MSNPEPLRRIIKNGAIVDDTWRDVDDEEPGPLPDGDIIVGVGRWRAEREALLKRGTGLGLRLKSDETPDGIADDVGQFQIIAVEFPVMTDGRAFSTGRRLREQYGFQGELRAVGDVLRDQLYYMHRCGFNAFEVRADKSLEDALKAFTEFSVTYQPGTDEPHPLWRRTPRG